MTNNISNSDFFKRLSDNDLLGEEIALTNEVEINQSIISWHYRLIKNVIFKEKVIVRDAEINSGLTFSNCNFEKGIVFHNVKSTNYDSHFNPNDHSILFLNCSSDYIVFEQNCLMTRSVIISKNCKVEKVSINKMKIENLASLS